MTERPVIRIPRDRILYSLDKAHPPAATVDPGAIVCLETWDARTGTIQSERDLFTRPHPKGPNPATGPIAVRGAEPGDALVVEILDIRLAARGFTGIRPQLGVLGHLMTDFRTKMLDIVDGMVIRGDVKVSQCCEPSLIAATARVVMPRFY